jgi:cob(I)alamin adenosyltransferase
MRITKVYTKTGDKGKTRLAGGQPVWKDALRVEAYGTVDELSAVIGVARAFVLKECAGVRLAQVELDLRWMQNKLLDLGGLLATKPGQSFPNMPSIEEADVARLERSIDGWQKDLQPLKEFILPGGGITASMLHHARTVCRRAERRCVSLMRKEQMDPTSIVFLNRLSDALFVLARWVAQVLGEPEVLWERTRPT